MLRMALAVGLLAEDVVVEHRLLERDREHFLRPEADRVRELLRVVDAADLEHPHADSIVGDAQADVLAGELVLLEEGAQRGGERVRVAELAAGDDAVLEVLACDLRDLRDAVVHDLGGSDLGRSDLQAHELLLAAHGRVTLRLRRLVGLAALLLGRLLRLGLAAEERLALLFGFSAFGSSAVVSFFFRLGSRSEA